MIGHLISTINDRMKETNEMTPMSINQSANQVKLTNHICGKEDWNVNKNAKNEKMCDIDVKHFEKMTRNKEHDVITTSQQFEMNNGC
jgi:hypothetical protein